MSPIRGATRIPTRLADRPAEISEPLDRAEPDHLGLSESVVA